MSVDMKDYLAYQEGYEAGKRDAAAAIEALQAQLPKRGKWKTTDAFPHRVYCSNCFRTYVPNDRWQIWVDKPGEGGLERNYCPSCGAKMNDSNALNALDNAQDGPIITPCRGCSEYDGYGGCKSKGGCARARMEVHE